MASKVLALFRGRRLGFDSTLSPLLLLDVAASREEHAKGLMGRTHLPPDTGMLFIMGKLGRHGFWMRDTPLALDIAWLARDGRVQELGSLKPFDETTVQPRADAYYALEMSAGSFARYGVRVGDHLVVDES